MATLSIDQPVTPLRQRMLDDMTMRAMGARTQHDYVRHVRAFAAFLKRSPDTATAEDVRRFQLHQREHGVGEGTISSSVSALRFLFDVTLERPDLSRRLGLILRAGECCRSAIQPQSTLAIAFASCGAGQFAIALSNAEG